MVSLNRKSAASMALTTLLSMSWVNTVDANIKFARVNTTRAYNPGDVIVLTWADDIFNITAPNLDPFDLSLRALTGQRYAIQSNVSQSLLQFRVTLPLEATGGLHSFYAYYSGPGNEKETTNQFNITGPEVIPQPTTDPTTTTPLPTTGVPKPTDTSSSSGGLSGGALGGIIGGVVVLLLIIAFIFFFRRRRLSRENSKHSRLSDSKEPFNEAVVARSGPDGPGPMGRKEGGGGGGGMMPSPMAGPGGPGSRPSRDEYNNSPRSMHPMHPMQQQNGNHHNLNVNTRNPFDGPDEGTSPRMRHDPNQMSPREMYSPSPSSLPYPPQHQHQHHQQQQQQHQVQIQHHQQQQQQQIQQQHQQAQQSSQSQHELLQQQQQQHIQHQQQHHDQQSILLHDSLSLSNASASRIEEIDRLSVFLTTAPTYQLELSKFLLPTGETISCVLWNELYHITGTDIVRSLVSRFESFGRPVRNIKKFEEGVFSDL
ncbi:homeodomain transcription factor ste12 [Entomortierella beljakovae]|nr:homeodomain transcription factor ste12 [Entomortierella beljakovae]